MKCGKELTQLDRGAYRKFVNRGSTSFLCKSCLAEKFGIEERVLDEKIDAFPETGMHAVYLIMRKRFLYGGLLAVQKT